MCLLNTRCSSMLTPKRLMSAVLSMTCALIVNEAWPLSFCELIVSNWNKKWTRGLSSNQECSHVLWLSRKPRFSYAEKLEGEEDDPVSHVNDFPSFMGSWFYKEINGGKFGLPSVARVDKWPLLPGQESADLPLPQANINTFFSLRAKCWLRGGAGRQFPRNV